MGKLARPLSVMGILNITPDSFSDGGQYNNVDDALRRAEAMIEAGATWLDIGGESTRPGAEAVAEAEELDRVIPVLSAIKQRLKVHVSVDTTKPAVMRAAVDAGVDMINDVNALREPGAIEAVAGSDVEVCLMHMQGEPRTMQHDPRYEDVVCEVKTFLEDRIQQCAHGGIEHSRIWLDQALGSASHNVTTSKCYNASKRFMNCAARY